MKRAEPSKPVSELLSRLRLYSRELLIALALTAVAIGLLLLATGS